MESRIQLKHPAGKKAVSMDQQKYATIEKALMNCLRAGGEVTHTEILKSLTEEFKKNNTTFEGSVEWHLEWVKLDLEARNVIKRIVDQSQIKFTIA